MTKSLKKIEDRMNFMRQMYGENMTQEQKEAMINHEALISFNKQIKESSKALSKIKNELKPLFIEDLPLWRNVFDAMYNFWDLHVDVRTLADEYIKWAIENDEAIYDINIIEVAFYITSRLHNHFYELIVLLENGHLEGAYTLWYAMHELYCSFLFIVTSDEPVELSKNYIQYAYRDNGSYSWAKVDKRLDSVKSKSVPFSEIELLCGVVNEWYQDIPTFYRHLGATDAREINPDEAPPISFALQEFGVAISIFYGVRTLQLTTFQFAQLFEHDKLLVHLKTLEMWEEKIMDMIEEVQKAYENVEK